MLQLSKSRICCTAEVRGDNNARQLLFVGVDYLELKPLGLGASWAAGSLSDGWETMRLMTAWPRWPEGVVSTIVVSTIVVNDYCC